MASATGWWETAKNGGRRSMRARACTQSPMCSSASTTPTFWFLPVYTQHNTRVVILTHHIRVATLTHDMTRHNTHRYIINLAELTQNPYVVSLTHPH